MTETKAKPSSSSGSSDSGSSSGSGGSTRIKNGDGQYLGPDGGVIDAPVLPAFEARLADAHTRADEDDIAEVMDEYEGARDDHVRKLHKRAADKRKRGDDK